MPAIIAMTGPPMTGKSFPRRNAGTAIARQSSIPLPFSLMNVIISEPSFRKISAENNITQQERNVNRMGKRR